MQISVKRMLRTRGAVVAGITALAVGLALILGRVLETLISLISLSTTAELYDLTGLDPFAGFGYTLLVSILPFTVGYFLGLWVVAPITEALRIGHVITRAILATGIGATLWFIVFGLTTAVIAMTSTSETLGFEASPQLIGNQLIYALQLTLAGFVTVLPLGVLGGVLLWLWRTANPAEHHIEGLIDV